MALDTSDDLYITPRGYGKNKKNYQPFKLLGRSTRPSVIRPCDAILTPASKLLTHLELRNWGERIGNSDEDGGSEKDTESFGERPHLALRLSVVELTIESLDALIDAATSTSTPILSMILFWSVCRFFAAVELINAKKPMETGSMGFCNYHFAHAFY